MVGRRPGERLAVRQLVPLFVSILLRPGEIILRTSKRSYPYAISVCGHPTVLDRPALSARLVGWTDSPAAAGGGPHRALAHPLVCEPTAAPREEYSTHGQEDMVV